MPVIDLNLIDSWDDAGPLFQWKLIYITLLTFFGSCLCSGGGIGGGGFYLPVYILILRLDPKLAIPLSKATIFGVAIGGYLVNFRKRHPHADRPLINYDCAVLMEPMTLCGTIIGVILNVTFPKYVIIICLALLLTATAFKTFKKGIALRAKELQLTDGNVYSTIPDEPSDPEFSGADFADETIVLQKMLDNEKATPLIKIFFLFLTWVGMLVMIFIAGGDGKSLVGIKCGSLLYWLVLAAIYPYLAIITYKIGLDLRNDHKSKVRVGYKYIEGDIKWNKRTTILFPLISVVAGIAAGFLGIGGGMVKGPVLLEMGVLPQVGVVTSAFMILFTSSATTFQFLIFGRLQYAYALWFCMIGLLGAIVGHMTVGAVVKKYKKQYFISFLLGSVTVISGILLGGLLIVELINDQSFTFNGVCSNQKA